MDDVNVKLSLTMDGKIKFSSGSEKVRLDSLEKFLGRNPDAILVKLGNPADTSLTYKPGHVCRIEEDENKYYVFVGKHLIGQLPDEAIAFAEQFGYGPQFLVSIVGKVEDDGIYIYLAE